MVECGCVDLIQIQFWLCHWATSVRRWTVILIVSHNIACWIKYGGRNRSGWTDWSHLRSVVCKEERLITILLLITLSKKIEIKQVETCGNKKLTILNRFSRLVNNYHLWFLIRYYLLKKKRVHAYFFCLVVPPLVGSCQHCPFLFNIILCPTLDY